MRSATLEPKMGRRLTHAPTMSTALALACFLAAAPQLTAEQDAPAVDITSVESVEDHLVIVHSAVPTGSRRSLYRMDRSVGYWRRPSAGSMRYEAQSRTYRDSGVEVGREYCYVLVTRRDGQSRGTQGKAFCAVFTAGDATIRPPTAPTDLEVVRARTTNLGLEFVDRADNEDSLVIERRFARSPDWEVIKTFLPQSGAGRKVRFQDGDLEMEVRYCYRVRAVNADGSSVSNGACETTEPLAVGIPDPMSIDGPAVMAITHPDEGTLQVRWVDEPGEEREWMVYLYASSDLQNPIVRARTRDHRDSTSRSSLQSHRFERLDPLEVYCARVVRGSGGPLGGSRQCESPYAERRQAEHSGPSNEEVPRIMRLSTPEDNGALTISLSSGLSGQLVDVTRASTGERTTDLRWRDGRDVIEADGLYPGETYCVRMFNVNRFGSRYGPLECARTRADPPVRPRNLRVDSIEHEVIRLRWDAASRASEYTLRYQGERRVYTDHDGKKGGIRDTTFRFEAKSQYVYCFSVESANRFGESGASAELCGVRALGQREISYSARLEPNIPDEGPIIYSHTVNPGPPSGARLTKVHIVGNDFTPYVVQFIKPAPGTVTCPTSSTDGVTVEPGGDLAGTGLNVLFGSPEPQIGSNGLPLLACKAIRDGGVGTTDPIPITVTYRRP